MSIPDPAHGFIQAMRSPDEAKRNPGGIPINPNMPVRGLAAA
jgi:hypothetical protein